ncbi:MAG: PSD1 and planctomycete cytochrome C domain-containing protein [Phycisphaeraceae bacterium]
MRPIRSSITVLAVALAATSPLCADDLSFNRDIRPILSDNCFTCHGFDAAARKAGLRLDTFQGATAELESGFHAIVPGKSGESELIHRLTTDDKTEVMPPRKTGKQLTAKQIDLLKRWIDSGAKWEGHWAFLAPQRPTLPQVKNKAWPRNAIDHFVLAKLEREGLAPSPPADARTLLRRASFDLTGLPPTPLPLREGPGEGQPHDQQQRAAYAAHLTRLLASPHYGEHMASFWLDAARYADTNGYQGDQTRTMWLWRDWVVRAYNDNMPFDQFTMMQIAGDLMEEGDRGQESGVRSQDSANNQQINNTKPTHSRGWVPSTRDDLLLATGFNRNHPLNGEGGRIAEESRVEYVMDRAETTGTVWLGLTVGCARCHDHKYDPLKQSEYYQLYAYFNSIDERGNVDAGGNANPVMPFPTADQAKQADALQKEIASLQKEMQLAPKDVADQAAAWEAKHASQLLEQESKAMWQSLRPAEYKADNEVTWTLRDDLSLFITGNNPVNNNYTITYKVSPGTLTALRLEALTDPSFTAGGIARSDSGNFVLTKIEVELDGKPVKIASAKADFEQGDLTAASALDSDKNTGWAVWNPANMKLDRKAMFLFAAPVKLEKEATLIVRLKHESQHKFHNLGRFRLALTSHDNPSLEGNSGVAQDLLAALRVAAKDRTPSQRKVIETHVASLSREPLKAKVEAAKKKLADLEKSYVKSMVMKDLAKPREAFVLKVGQYDQPDKTKPVSPGIPEVLHALPPDAPPNRLALARWLVARDNPLTARVIVNRLWQQIFGIGLVKTSEDFGIQSEAPSHPELLDWLAVEFIDSGWDTKHILKLILTSATYQQSSRITPALLERDPENRLLARGPRFRLSVFALRDQALQISGLLVDKMGGPGVKPYQPPGPWEEFSLGKIKYEQDHGEALYRRSLYTFWRRSVAPTMFFDTPSRQVCIVRQGRTNTPLHALTLMNDVAYVEAARAMAERVMKETPLRAGDDGARFDPDIINTRLKYAFELATSHPPKAEELKLLRASLDRSLAHFRADVEAAKKLLAIGESPRDEKLDPAEHAAYTAVMTVILNLDEVITKE